MGSQARNTGYQVAHYIRKTITFAQFAAAGGSVRVGTIPGGSMLDEGQCRIDTAFNAGTTNPITVQTLGGSAGEILASADITSGTPGGYTNGRALAVQIPNDIDVMATYTPTGTAATTGQATFVLPYFPNNE